MAARGRKAKRVTKDEEVRFRVSAEDKAAFQRAAQAESRHLSDWVRLLAQKAAGLYDAK